MPAPFACELEVQASCLCRLLDGLDDVPPLGHEASLVRLDSQGKPGLDKRRPPGGRLRRPQDRRRELSPVREALLTEGNVLVITLQQGDERRATGNAGLDQQAESD